VQHPDALSERARNRPRRRARTAAVCVTGVALSTLSLASCQIDLGACTSGVPGCASGEAAAISSPYAGAVQGLPNLALWAPLDESAGPVLHDAGPKGANGAFSSSGVSFDGLDSASSPASGFRAVRFAAGGSATVPHNAALNLSTNAASRWLLSVDVKVDATDGYPVILQKGSATNGFTVFADPSTQSVGFIVNGHQSAWGGVSFTNTRQLVIEWDGTNLRFVVDGVELGSAPAADASVTDTGALQIAPGGGVTLSKLVIADSADPGAPAALHTALQAGDAAATVPATVSTVPATTTTTAKPSTPTTAPPTTAPPTTAPPTTAAPTTTTPATTAGNGARLQWSDEFNGPAGTGVDASRWEQEVGAPTNNGRVEYLTGGTHNVALDGNGNLVITARRESYGGRSFTSGRIESYSNFTTGYLEFRAKVPTWQGTMPGLWTYGASGYGAQNGFSEIDALEIQTGASIDPHNVRQTIHGGMPDGSTIWQLGWSQNKADFSPNLPGDAWHTYGAYVNPNDGSVTFYVDGKVNVRYAKGQQPSGGVWPYATYAQKVVVEIEMGGYSGQMTSDMNSDTLQLDYVRVYDKPPY
jgi:beta-glucanase (GH16 family)